MVYGISHRFISRFDVEDLKDPTGSLFRVIGMLVSLMLSLAFAEVVVESRAIQNTIEREAEAIADTFNNLQRLDMDGTREIRTVLIDYTQAIIDDDWPALAQDKIGERAGALKRKLEEDIWNLKTTTPVGEMLLSQILSDIDLISDYRVIRFDAALAEPPVYIYLMMFGFLLTMACFGAYPPVGPIVALVSLYTVFVALVLYLIVALSDPFQGGIGVDPTTFERMIEVMRARNT